MTTIKMIILDRDGVINQDSDAYIKSPEEWQPIPGSIEAIARLKKAGYTVAVATNQSGIARGLFSTEVLQAIHHKMNSLIEGQGEALDALTYCPHSPDDQCDCRKPAPGLLYQIERSLKIPLSTAYFVGDSLKDLQAATAAGAKPILVKTGKGEKTVGQIAGTKLADTPVFADLNEFVTSLLKLELPKQT